MKRHHLDKGKGLLMLRKHCSAIFIITSLILLPNYVFAENTGAYVGIQFGYTNTNQDALTSADALADFHTIAGTIPGSVGNINTPDATVTSFAGKTNDDVFTGRFYVGYQFYPSIALEGGFTSFRTVTLSYDAMINSGVGVVNQSDNTSTQQYALDLLVKGILPFDRGFDLYVKLGATLVFMKVEQQIDLNNVPDPLGGTPLSFSYTENNRTSKGYPTLAIGLEYFFSENTGVNIEYSKILTNSSGNNSYAFTSIGIIQNINTIV